MAPDDVLERLRAADWERIFLSLTAYAVTRSSRLYLVKGGGELPQGHRPSDIAHNAVQLVFEGERHWDPDAHPDLLRYLKGVVSSLVSNLITGADHVRRADEASDEPLDLDGYQGIVTPSPLATTESAACVEELRAIVDRETAGDDGLAAVAMGFEDGMRPAEIAELLSIDVQEVYGLTRKLRRRLLSAMDGHECWEDHPVMATASRP